MTDVMPPSVRLKILEFDPITARMSVRQFCRSVGVSTSSFYRLRATQAERGRGAAMVAGSRAPTVPARVHGDFAQAAIVAARRRLMEQGADAGPRSIQWVLHRSTFTPLPSTSTIARVLRAQGLVEPSPRKRPRASWRRFAREKANELWQLDGIEWRLGGRSVTIYQVVDDCTRLEVALLAGWGAESQAGAIAALQHGIERYGAPASVLTDNGLAFNQHRRGRLSGTERWLGARGIRPISGQTGKPTTQGKVERSHQPIRKWLDAHPADTLEDLQAVLDRFDQYYNHERQHQALKQFWTPAMAWDAAPKDGPEPAPIPPQLLYPRSALRTVPPIDEPVAFTRRVASNRRIRIRGREIMFSIGLIHATIGVILTPDTVELYDPDGVLHAVIPWPQPGTGSIPAHRAPFRVQPHPNVSQMS